MSYVSLILRGNHRIKLPVNFNFDKQPTKNLYKRRLWTFSLQETGRKWIYNCIPDGTICANLMTFISAKIPWLKDLLSEVYHVVEGSESQLGTKL